MATMPNRRRGRERRSREPFMPHTLQAYLLIGVMPISRWLISPNNSALALLDEPDDLGDLFGLG